MGKLTFDKLESTKVEVNKTIMKCEKIMPKFDLGTSQYTLLINRIRALNLVKNLIENELDNKHIVYKKQELEEALVPIESIMHKCLKAQSKHEINSKQYQKYIPLIDSMLVARQLIGDVLSI